MLAPAPVAAFPAFLLLAVVACGHRDIGFNQSNDATSVGAAGVGGAAPFDGAIGNGGAADDVPDAAADASPAEQACNAYIDAICELQARCMPYWAEWSWGDVAGCKIAHKAGCLAPFAAPGTLVQPASVSSCALALGSVSCDDYLFRNVWPAECKTVAGAVPNGAPCALDEQCESASCLSDGTGGPCGICRDKSPRGGVCRSSSNCEDGMQCDRNACSRIVPEGQFCTSISSCGAFMRCIGLSQTLGNGLCGRALGLDAPCDPDPDDCDWEIAGLYCDATTRTCRKRAIAKAGESCRRDDGTLLNCPGVTLCEFSRGFVCPAVTPTATSADPASCR